MSGWRPALRIARRDALRHRGRSALVAVLVALPVLAASFVDVVARSEQLDPQDVVAVTLLPTEQAQVQAFSPGAQVDQDPVDPSRAAGTGTAGTGTTALTAAALDAQVQALVPQGDRVLVARTWGDAPRVEVADHTLRVMLGENDFGDGTGWLSVTEGAPPTRADQVVVSGDLADHEGLRVGAVLRVPSSSGTTRTYRVSGVTRAAVLPNPLRVEGVLEASIFGLPGALVPADAPPSSMQVGWSVVGPVPLTWTDVLRLNAVGYTALSRQVVLNPPDAAAAPQAVALQGAGTSSTVVGVLAVAVLLVLLQIALLAGPALAVGARRNTRTLALVAAAGGRGRHLRLIVLAGGLVVGAAGSLVAAGLGAGLAAVLTPWLRSSGVMHAPRVDVHLLDLLGLAAVGAVTALAAAWMPARQAARLDVIATLTGRRGQATPRLHVPVLGLLLTAVGIGVGVVAARSYYPVWLASAIAVAEIGLIVATGSVVSLAARLARRTALPVRMALRDAARQRGRTVPAVAAVMASVAGLVSAGIFLATQDAYDRNRYTPMFAADNLYVRSMTGPTPTRSAADDLAGVRTQVRSAFTVQEDLIVSGVGASTQLTVDTPRERICPTLPGGPPTDRPDQRSDAERRAYDEQVRRQTAEDSRCHGWVVRSSDIIGFSTGDQLVDDTGRTLALLTGSPDQQVAAALAAGRAVVWDPHLVDSAGHVLMHVDDPNQGTTGPVVALPATLAQSRPGLGTGVVLPTSAVRRLGLTVTPVGYLARLSKPPTPEAVAGLNLRLGRLQDWTVMTETGPPSSAGATLLALVAAAMLVALVGTLTAVGLAQVEGRADSATLSAVGAGPGLRRRLAAMQALTIAGLGTGLGVLGGMGAAWGMVRLRLAPEEAASTISPSGGATAGTVPVVGLSDTVWSLVVPWPQLALGTVGLVVIAMTVAYATTRSTLPLERRLAT